MEFVSTIPGFDTTAIKGIIEATPNISRKAIIKIISKTRAPLLLSVGTKWSRFFNCLHKIKIIILFVPISKIFNAFFNSRGWLVIKLVN